MRRTGTVSVNQEAAFTEAGEASGQSVVAFLSELRLLPEDQVPSDSETTEETGPPRACTVVPGPS